jgi:hypothetical protein
MLQFEFSDISVYKVSTEIAFCFSFSFLFLIPVSTISTEYAHNVKSNMFLQNNTNVRCYNIRQEIGVNEYLCLSLGVVFRMSNLQPWELYLYRIWLSCVWPLVFLLSMTFKVFPFFLPLRYLVKVIPEMRHVPVTRYLHFHNICFQRSRCCK